MPGVWHHITQRGNRQQATFIDDTDRRFYLRLLDQYAMLHGIRLVGYCLMPNHVHLIAIPEHEDSLARALGRTHTDYSRWFNMRRGETGHLWQNRFYSCPMDDRHGWEALRYVELNPVRAGLVDHAAAWQWSSAAAHLGWGQAPIRLDFSEWRLSWTPESWREALEQGIADACLLDRIRDATRIGRPMGDDDFVRLTERCLERILRPQRRGRKPATAPSADQLNLGIT
jgi:putative transposase